MGLIGNILGLILGDGRNAVAQTAEVFRVNAEADAARLAGLQQAALAQFGREFAQPRRGRFDRLMDALNRLPRPAMAVGTLGLFVAAMVDPVWFAARMQGLALAPEPLWWLLGAIVSFYFGARHQLKGQEFQRQLAQQMALAPQVMQNIDDLRDLTEQDRPEEGAAAPGAGRPVPVSAPGAPAPLRAVDPGDNAALRDWLATRRQGAT